MLGKMMQMLFVPKRARAKMAQRRKPPVGPPVKKRDVPPPLSQGTYQSPDQERDRLLTDTMALYRQQREDVYDTLDEETKRQIEEDAEKAFGQVLRPKS